MFSGLLNKLKNKLKSMKREKNLRPKGNAASVVCLELVVLSEPDKGTEALALKVVVYLPEAALCRHFTQPEEVVDI